MSTNNPSDQWQPPRELQHSSPRPVVFTSRGITLHVLAAIFVIGGIGAGIALQMERNRQLANVQALREEGVNVAGQVTRVYETGSKSDEYRVQYEFTANGGRQAGDAQVDRNRWSLLKAGGDIAVRYVASNPAVNSPVDDPPQTMPVWVPPVFALMLVGASGLLLWRVRRERRLLEEGKPAPGVVLPRQRFPSRRRRRLVHYEFTVPGEGVRKGRSQTSPLPEVGSRVTILYDPNNPRRNAMYPMCLVKVER